MVSGFRPDRFGARFTQGTAFGFPDREVPLDEGNHSGPVDDRLARPVHDHGGHRHDLGAALRDGAVHELQASGGRDRVLAGEHETSRARRGALEHHFLGLVCAHLFRKDAVAGFAGRFADHARQIMGERDRAERRSSHSVDLREVDALLSELRDQRLGDFLDQDRILENDLAVEKAVTVLAAGQERMGTLLRTVVHPERSEVGEPPNPIFLGQLRILPLLWGWLKTCAECTRNFHARYTLFLAYWQSSTSFKLCAYSFSGPTVVEDRDHYKRKNH